MLHTLSHSPWQCDIASLVRNLCNEFNLPRGEVRAAVRAARHEQAHYLRELRAEAEHIYAETLRRWHHSFTQRRAQVQAQGFDPAFQRTWEFYLAYCEAAFDADSIDVVQYTLVRD